MLLERPLAKTAQITIDEVALLAAPLARQEALAVLSDMTNAASSATGGGSLRSA